LPQPETQRPILYDVWTEDGMLRLTVPEIDLILMSCCENFLSRQHQPYIVALLKVWSAVACDCSTSWQVSPQALVQTQFVLKMRTPPVHSPNRVAYDRLYDKLCLQPAAKPQKAP